MERGKLSYFEHETLNLLKNKIQETGTNANNLREEYRYIYHDRLYIFDLVELDENEKIIKIYEIKTFDAIKLNYTSSI